MDTQLLADDIARWDATLDGCIRSTYHCDGLQVPYTHYQGGGIDLWLRGTDQMSHAAQMAMRDADDRAMMAADGFVF
jgi:hypothetical protein